MPRVKPWYCVAVHHKQEELATRELAQQGYGVFCPYHTPADAKVDRKTGIPIPRPMWSGYLFVSFRADLPWYPILSTRGVKGFASIQSERPWPMRIGVVENLMEVSDASSSIMPGATVEVIGPNAGIWRGHRGIAQASSDELVELLFKLLNNEIVVTFHRADLRKVPHG